LNFKTGVSDGILDDFWVYGTDSGCSPGNMHWCSDYKSFQPKEVVWAAGEPSNNGRCVYMKSSNSSTLATANCSTEMRFLCDVRKKGTSGMAMQQECLETWNVSSSKSVIKSHFFCHFKNYFAAELDLLTNKSVDIQSLGQHVKV
jgi:hypothetical protein